MSKDKSTIEFGFEYQEIPLEEAMNAVLAGEGNYAELKAHLLNVIPQIEEKNSSSGEKPKAFAFGLPKGKEVPEDARRGICMAVNSALKRAKILWRVTYSGTRKVFVCVPKQRPAHKVSGYTPRSKFNKIEGVDAEILKLYNAGKSVSEIAKVYPLQRAKYLCYQKFPRGHRRPHPQVERKPSKFDPHVPVEGAPNPQQFIDQAREIFNYSGDFRDRQGKAIRKAISVVGYKDLRLKARDLGNLIGISNGGVLFNASSNTPFGSEQIKTLRAALK